MDKRSDKTHSKQDASKVADKEEYQKIKKAPPAVCVRDLLYLTGCAVQGKKPDIAMISKMDLEKVFTIACVQHLAAVSYYGLEGVLDELKGIADPVLLNKWKQKKEKSIRREILFTREREKHLEALERMGIWYLPMKGIIISGFYPGMGMREMADNDILFDEKYHRELRQYMISEGYVSHDYGKSIHDTYQKDPVFNFEFHRRLFSEISQNQKMTHYFENIKERLIKDEGNAFGYHLCTDDLYVYVCAHSYRHYSMAGGTGLRTIVDNYLFCSLKKEELHWDVIDHDLALFDALAFDRTLRSLSRRLLEDPKAGHEAVLTDEEEAMLGLMSVNGTYGTLKTKVENKIRNYRKNRGVSTFTWKEKVVYSFRRIFPSMEFMKYYYHILKKAPFLLPAVYVYRLIKVVLFKRKNVRRELEALKESE